MLNSGMQPMPSCETCPRMCHFTLEKAYSPVPNKHPRTFIDFWKCVIPRLPNRYIYILYLISMITSMIIAVDITVLTIPLSSLTLQGRLTIYDPIGGCKGWNPLSWGYLTEARQNWYKCVENAFFYQTVQKSTSDSLLLRRYERLKFGENFLKNAYFWQPYRP